MYFKTYLTSSAGQINKELERFFKVWSGRVVNTSAKLTNLNNLFVTGTEGGKRLRGTLVKLAYEMVAGQTNDEILKPAAAFEIFQTAILAQDDIIDKSPLRRGKPTIYKALGANHYATSQTICLGDIGFFLAQQLIIDSNFPQSQKTQALASFVETMLQTALGEMLDIELPHTGEFTDTQNDISKIFLLKTARYTIVGPMHLGAILAGADQNLLDQIEQFGNSLGIAFQIQDDILGVFADEKVVGKSVTSDIEEGKITFLYSQALQKANQKQRATLKTYYGNGPIDQGGLDEVRKVFIDTGSLSYSQEKAKLLVKSAKQVLAGLKVTKEYKNLLMEMADFMVSRVK